MVSERTRCPRYLLIAHDAACVPSSPFLYASINLIDLAAKLKFDDGKLVTFNEICKGTHRRMDNFGTAFNDSITFRSRSASDEDRSFMR
jgi:hypothetical protein